MRREGDAAQRKETFVSSSGGGEIKIVTAENLIKDGEVCLSLFTAPLDALSLVYHLALSLSLPIKHTVFLSVLVNVLYLLLNTCFSLSLNGSALSRHTFSFSCSVWMYYISQSHSVCPLCGSL